MSDENVRLLKLFVELVILELNYKPLLLYFSSALACLLFFRSVQGKHPLKKSVRTAIMTVTWTPQANVFFAALFIIVIILDKVIERWGR